MDFAKLMAEVNDFVWGPIMLAFLLLFIITYVLIKLLEKILGWIFKGDILKSLDRSLGFFFGLVWIYY